jgi:hypothetical protein
MGILPMIHGLEARATSRRTFRRRAPAAVAVCGDG